MAYLDSNFYYDAALRAIGNATQQAQETGTAAINQGSSYIKDYLAQSNAAMSPQVQASYGALDSYFDSLGIARPQAGSAAVAQANKTTARYDATVKGKLQTALQGVVASLGSWAGKDVRDSANAAINSANSETDMYNLLKQWSGYGGNFARMGTAAKNALNGITPNSAEAIRLNSTQEGRDQMAFAQQVQDGTAPMYQASAADIYNKFSNTPGYQFAMNEGINKVQNSAAAKGMLNSGRTLKGIEEFATGLADQTYQQYVSNQAQAVGLTSPYAGQTSQGYLTAGQTLNQNQTNIADLNVNSALAYGSAASNLYAGRASQNWALENGLFGKQTTGSYPQLTGAL